MTSVDSLEHLLKNSHDLQDTPPPVGHPELRQQRLLLTLATGKEVTIQEDKLVVDFAGGIRLTAAEVNEKILCISRSLGLIDLLGSLSIDDLKDIVLGQEVTTQIDQEFFSDDTASRLKLCDRYFALIRHRLKNYVVQKREQTCISRNKDAGSD